MSYSDDMMARLARDIELRAKEYKLKVLESKKQGVSKETINQNYQKVKTKKQ
ncbi:MAG: hypothetical protein WC343_04320 [Bacilli bacterium]|jgi:hypothetical protein